MAVTVVSAADRDTRLVEAGARSGLPWRTPQSRAGGRLHISHALLAVSSLIAAAAIALAYSGRAAADAADGRTSEPSRLVNLNELMGATELESLLAPVFPDSAVRQIAAAHIHEFITSRRERGSELPNVGALLDARVDLDGRSRPVLTRDQLAAIKPFAVVRTHDTHRRHVFFWGAVFVACAWAIALFWWACGIRGDYLLLSAAHLLSAIGFAALVSRQDPLRDLELFVRYAHLTSAGLLVFGLVSVIDVGRIARAGLTYLPLAGAFGLSLALILFGQGPAGSDAKVNLGPLQPVEFIRLLLALFLAGYFARRWEVLRGVRGRVVRDVNVPAWLDLPRVDYVLPLAAGVGAALLFFFLQKDLGPALLLSCVFLVTYAIARNRVGLAAAGFVTLVAGFSVGYALNISSTLTARVAMWQSAWDNGVRGGDQIAQAIWALSAGGVSGAGLGFGETSYLPAGFTDLMLAAVGEELGFAGLAAIAVLYALIAARGFAAALHADDDYAFFLGIVLTLFLILPVIVMAAGMLGLIPLTGVVTPFLSFGGSAMLANFAALGALTAITRQSRWTPPMTSPFQAGVRWLGNGLIVASAVLAAVLLDVQVLRADAYVVRPHLGLQADGGRRYQYNPRIADVLATIPRGTVFDRRGLPLATSDADVARRAGDGYRKAGLETSCNPIVERCYPLGGRAFHLLGDVRSGRNWSASNTAYVERDAQARLRGFDDRATVVRSIDAAGRPTAAIRRDYQELIPLLRHRYTPDHPEVKAFLARSRDVRLTIDAPFQAAVARILEKYAARSATGQAAAVVLDPDTGELLAVASYPFPALDTARLSGGEDETASYFDRARFGLYPPGSTFKIATAAAALRHDTALARSRFMCSRHDHGRVGANIAGFGLIRDDVLDTRPHGSIDMHDGLVQSCNAYFAQLAVRVGAASIFDTASVLGISVARDGSIPRLRATLAQAGYGQGDVVATPLRMARLAAAIASDGLLRDTRVEHGAPQSAAPQRLLTPDAARTLGQYLRDAVLNGTARGLRAHPGRIAGKTGTAEVHDARSHAWFVGYAPHGPADRRVAFAVLVEHGGYGSLAAAPAAGEIVTAAAAKGLIQQP